MNTQIQELTYNVFTASFVHIGYVKIPHRNAQENPVVALKAAKDAFPRYVGLMISPIANWSRHHGNT